MAKKTTPAKAKPKSKPKVAPTKAKKPKSKVRAKGAAGAHAKRLDQVARQSQQLATSATVATASGSVGLAAKKHGSGGVSANVDLPGRGMLMGGYSSLSQAMVLIATKYGAGDVQFNTVSVNASKSPLERKELKRLALFAWCEVCGNEVPSDEQLQSSDRSSKSAKAQRRDQFLDLLRGGPKGIKKFNALRKDVYTAVGSFRQADFSGAKLGGATLAYLDLRDSNFSGADLSRTTLTKANLVGARFSKADLSFAICPSAKMQDADFSGARLQRTSFRVCNLQRANFQNAILVETDLAHANLCGADFSNARLKDVNSEKAMYDEQTRWPAGFVPGEAMVWKGAGVSPGARKKIAAARPVRKLDVDGFVERLKERVDASRFSKAVQMLKADRFQLFADVQDDHLVGVVKSQTDKELVYSCRLAADGKFACCTQNLNVCGGLHGKLCKHLLVLILGLAQAKRLDLEAVDEWAFTSWHKKPELDKDAMSETLLRYKGAEAGEIDWRPTETVPEDFYAY